MAVELIQAVVQGDGNPPSYRGRCFDISAHSQSDSLDQAVLDLEAKVIKYSMEQSYGEDDEPLEHPMMFVAFLFGPMALEDI